jgi:hypothetical protein
MSVLAAAVAAACHRGRDFDRRQLVLLLEPLHRRSLWLASL